jgi:hypothetical protein
MAPKPKEISIPDAPTVAGMKAKKVEYEAIEDEQEKELRLHKERWTFYVKELLPFGLATFFLGVAWLVSLAVLVRPSFSPAEKDWARTTFTAVTSGAAGILFGKQLGK